LIFLTNLLANFRRSSTDATCYGNLQYNYNMTGFLRQGDLRHIFGNGFKNHTDGCKRTLRIIPAPRFLLSPRTKKRVAQMAGIWYNRRSKNKSQGAAGRTEKA
jgi:hypothetical protein